MQAAQSAHAAFQFATEHPEETVRWHDESSYLIILGVPNEDALFECADKFSAFGVSCSLVREPDLDGQATSLAIGPSGHWRLLSNLPLLGREVVTA